MEIWDAYYKDGTKAGIELVRGEPIPDGLYHLACDVLVRHTDGDYLLMKRAADKDMFPGMYEATAGGSALKGESAAECIKRELSEETGIVSDSFTEIAFYCFTERNTLFYCYLCKTDCDKTSVVFQKGETEGYKWVSEDEFIGFVNSDEMIPTQKRRYYNYFKKLGYIKE